MIETVKGFLNQDNMIQVNFFFKHSEYMNCLHLNKTYLTIKKF